MKKCKIGIIGSGLVAQALAKGFVKHNYPVKIGTRSEEKYKELHSIAAGVEVGNFKEAADYGDILVLAVAGGVAKDALNLAGEGIKGKIIIDPTNPIDHAVPPENGVLHYFSDINRSLMEELQEEFPETKLVKAFSIIGNQFMVSPDFDGIPPSMFICGNDEDAKAQVSDILDLFGFDVWDMGAAESARAIEPLAMLWCIPGIRENKWNHALKMLKTE